MYNVWVHIESYIVSIPSVSYWYHYWITIVYHFLPSGIKAVDGTAKAGEDFTGKKAQQVQFNPGQTEGFWRVRIRDDNLFELAETFEVILHDAVMGSLEYPEHAIVKILDSEDGGYQWKIVSMGKLNRVYWFRTKAGIFLFFTEQNEICFQTAVKNVLWFLKLSTSFNWF